MIKIGDSVTVKANLTEELSKLEFGDYAIGMMKALIGGNCFVYDLWVDEQTGQEYATVDLCLEIPMQCLEKYNGTIR